MSLVILELAYNTTRGSMLVTICDNEVGLGSIVLASTVSFGYPNPQKPGLRTPKIFCD